MWIDDGINGFSNNIGLIGLLQSFFSLVGTYASIGVHHGRCVIESKICIFFKFVKFFWNFNFFNFLIFCLIIFYFKIFVTSDESGGAMALYGKWVCLWPYMGTPQVFREIKKPHTLLLWSVGGGRVGGGIVGGWGVGWGLLEVESPWLIYHKKKQTATQLYSQFLQMSQSVMNCNRKFKKKKNIYTMTTM